MADSIQPAGRDPSETVRPSTLLIVIGFALVLRLVNMAGALRSPLIFQPGPDEDFYLHFGQSVAAGATQPNEFAFMDPAYGYILGLIFKLAGVNLYVIYLIQVILDTSTALCIFLIGREFNRPTAGVLGALLYALTCTALYFSTTLLKATWVANFMTVWVLLSLVALRTPKIWVWFLFGAWCGYGVALRANLLLMAGLSVVLLTWLSFVWAKQSTRLTAIRLGSLCAGLAIPLILLSARNVHMSESFSPLPNNGGIVLHHLYNAENPTSGQLFPKFVKYATPIQIWRDYSKEAERRVGHSLTPHEVDRYWRVQAVEYIMSHPIDVVGNASRKAAEFLSYIEVPNNRSLEQDRLFSPLLRTLPMPFGWLLALGVPGIAILLSRDRRAVLVIAPIAVAAVTVVVFYSEDRFRFHAVPTLAFGAGVLLQELYCWFKSREIRKATTAIAVCALLGATSVVVASWMPKPQLLWDRVIWGYLKTNSKETAAVAKDLALRVAGEQPTNPKIQEVLAYIAATEGRYLDAARFYRRTVELRPDDHIAHYNLAKMLVKVGDREEAEREAAIAAKIEPLPEYQKLVDELAASERADARSRGFR